MNANAKRNIAARKARYAAINAAALASGPIVSRDRFIGESAEIRQGSQGNGMNRDNRVIADVPTVNGLTGSYPVPAQEMRRKSQVRRKGHKFDRLETRGARPDGVTDDSIESVRPGEAAARRVSFSGLTADMPEGLISLECKWMPNGRMISDSEVRKLYGSDKRK